MAAEAGVRDASLLRSTGSSPYPLGNARLDVLVKVTRVGCLVKSASRCTLQAAIAQLLRTGLGGKNDRSSLRFDACGMLPKSHRGLEKLSMVWVCVFPDLVRVDHLITEAEESLYRVSTSSHSDLHPSTSPLFASAEDSVSNFVRLLRLLS